ncbi:MAG: hypothetical protein KF730_13550 [Sphingomonas sp.]|uniref:hypothetical protein n=1 Tax=Sphingomonas sp. TaxID=28214 RepID=UPI0025D719D8|nr:hypothetical protein [Sphingomonas sp.]MBX3565589.1 hypothetical protein [Sphingomonas sp.]
MTDLTLQDDTDGLKMERSAEPPGGLRIPARFEARDFYIEVTPDQTIEHMLTIIATEHGLRIEDIYIVRENEDAPLICEEPVHHGHQRRHHVHHRQPVAVTVHYQTGSHHREFRRHASLEQVLDWAIRAFGIDASMAGEFELTRTGSTDELSLSDHVGHLAGKHNALALDLVRGDIANGADHA